VNYYYNSSGATNGQSLSASDLVNALANGIVSLSGVTHGSFATLTGGSSPLPGALNSYLGSNSPTVTGKPNAYLNWILLDNQFNYVSSYPQSGALQVGAAGTTGAGGLQSPLAYAGIPITKSGYLYIYVSNATPNWDVFFDNLSVRQYSGPMLEENHYYPFGLTMAGISDKALKTNYAENKYRFNAGSELQDKEFSDGSGLELYETPLRGLDPQLGRWWTVDPKPGDMISPYASMDNDPILYSDWRGDIVTTDDQTEDRYKKLKDQNQKDIQKLFGQIMLSAKSGGFGSKALDRAVTLFNKEVDFRNQLTTLEASDITYHISSASPGIDRKGRPLGGITDYNATTGQIDIKIGNSGIDVLAHELTHGYQFETGDVAFGLGKILMDISDERKAEETGYLFRSSGWQDFIVAGKVTDDFMRKRGYTDIPGTPLNLDSKGSDIYKATGDRFYNYYPDQSAREIFQKRNELMVKSGGQILFIYNDVLRANKK